MQLIAHRGNMNGKSELENQPEYVLIALNAGYDVEIDVWHIDDKYFLGHDEAHYEVNIDFLKQGGLWCHAKNISALHNMISGDAHCFWHQEDDVTLTSRGFLWTYPNKKLFSNSICVLPEIQNVDLSKIDIAGVCSDFVTEYRGVTK